MSDTPKLLPEWEAQEAVILAWPDEQTDWAPWLESVEQTYIELISAINEAGAGVVLLSRTEQIKRLSTLFGENARVLLVEADYNDTWVRDYGFLTCQANAYNQPVEFVFNGWGNKFTADKDNLINHLVLARLCKHQLTSYNTVVEGGALEIDKHGHLLSTRFCLTNPERNGDMSLDQYKALFSDAIGADKVTILANGHLEGDDTDGHIDTLVRFTPDNGLVIQSCFNRPEDSHFEGLSALVEECRTSLEGHQIFELPLPMIKNSKDERLPASYANYLICNQHIIWPSYQQPEDALARKVLQKAYPDFTLVAIDALPLIQQFGSIHCISMQVPMGTLKPTVVEQLNSGITHYVH